MKNFNIHYNTVYMSKSVFEKTKEIYNIEYGDYFYLNGVKFILDEKMADGTVCTLDPSIRDILEKIKLERTQEAIK